MCSGVFLMVRVLETRKVLIMVYDGRIEGRFVDLRSVTLDDAQFSYDIRADEQHRYLVGQVASSVEEQKKFIEWQMKQPGDYYFVVENKKGQRIGLTGVYNVHDGVGEIGREVSYGSPVETMETELLLEDFYSNVLKLEKITYVIYENNKRQLSIQRKRKIEPVKIVERSGVKSYLFEVDVQGITNSGKKRKLEMLLDRIEGI